MTTGRSYGAPGAKDKFAEVTGETCSLADDGLPAAMGPIPDDPTQALRHHMAIQEIRGEFRRHRVAEMAIEAPALTID